MWQGFDRGVIVGIVVLAAMMVGIATTSYLNTRALRDNDARAAHSREVLDAIGTVRADTRNLQAAQRGYLISGLPEWLPPYHRATDELRAGGKRLKELTAAEPEQLRRAEAAERDMQTGITQLDAVVDRRPDGVRVIVQMLRAGGERSFMDPLLDTLAEMDGVERDRLAAHQRRADAAYTQAVLYGVAAAALGLVALALFVLLRGSLRARVRTAARLLAQREVLNATLTSIGDAVIATDTAGRITFLNPVAEALTGWPMAEAIGHPLDQVFRIVNESTREPVENPARRALLGGPVVGLASNTVLVARDGTERPIDDSAAPIRDAAGHAGGAVLVFRDITDRKRAAVALRESEERHRQLADNLPAGFIYQIVQGADDSRRFSYVSGSVEAVCGVTPAQVIADPVSLYGMIVAEDRDRVRGAEEAAARGNGTFDCQFRVTARGAVRWLHCRSAPRTGPGGAALWDGVGIDVTELKRAEHERERLLREVEAERALLAEMFARAPSFVAVLRGPAHVFERANERYLDLVGGRPVIGKPVREALPEIEGQGFFELLDRVYRTGAAFAGTDARFLVRGRDGSMDERFADFVFQALRDGAGAVTGVLVHGVDLTARKRAEELVRRKDERLKLLLDRSRDYAVVITDRAGTVVEWTGGAEVITGYAPGDVLGTSLGVLYTPEDRAAGVAARELDRATREGRAEDKRWHLRKDGSRFYADGVMVPLRDEDGTPRGFGKVFRDATDRKVAEDNLARVTDASERRKRLYETALSNTPDLVYVFDLDHRFAYANEALLAMWGRTWDEAIGKNCLELGYEPWHAEMHDREIEQVVATRRPIRGEVPFTGTHGRRLYEYIFVPVLGADGAVEAIAGTTRDVTDRRRAEEALREKEQRALDILESISDAFFALDRAWRFTYVNRQAERILERQPGDLIGRVLWEEYPGLTGSAFEPAYRNAMDRAEASALTAYYPDHQRWYEVHAYPSPEGIAIYFRNVTERMAAELALKESEDRYRRAAAAAARAAEVNAKFRAFFDQGTNFAGVLSVGGTVVDANRLCLDACGFTRDDVLGRPFWECGWWSPSAALADLVRAGTYRAAGGQTFRTETNYFVADGAERVLDLILAPVTDETGCVLFVAATGTDITDRRRMEDALRDADRRKDEFIALLAHELRNPLAPIRNGLQIMRLAGTDETALTRARGMMERQLAHMVRIVDDLLDVSRINRNKMELRRSRVTLAEVIASAVETARPLIDDAGHELAVTLPDAAVTLDADLTRLAQVFSNLLTNSAKYTPPRGRIGIAAERTDDTVRVTVRDTGIGIPAESLPNIFDMFWQVNRSSERGTGGLGIGLALVRGLVEMHDGTVVATCDGPGRGTTFAVTLPVVPDAEGTTTRAPEAERAAPGSRRRVLVVDDNRDGAESMADMLALLDNEVRTAHDGQEAVAAAERFRPEVILMDIGMPKLNGLDATRRIRAHPWGRDTVIVALTGWGQDGDRERTRAAGCNGHLVKPVSLADLQTMLDTLHPKGEGGGWCGRRILPGTAAVSAAAAQMMWPGGTPHDLTARTAEAAETGAVPEENQPPWRAGFATTHHSPPVFSP